MKPLWQKLREEGARPSDIIEMFEVKLAPVPIFGIAKKLGIKLYRDKSLIKNQDCRLKITQSANGILEAEIYTNHYHASMRRRFIVSHELGHLLMHDIKIGESSGCLFNNSSSIEAEANSFSMQLLMPRSIINHYVMAGITDIGELARIFNTSVESMRIRLNSL